MIEINNSLRVEEMLPEIDNLFKVSAGKILAIDKSWKPGSGAPVYTVSGKYTSRGWTEWTQGFQFGSALLQYAATGDPVFLEIGLAGTLEHMAGHVSHVGVHDHGFNNISTYGNLLALLKQGGVPSAVLKGDGVWAQRFCELALKVSGAVQASRWTSLPDNLGFIYSFNGPHSLFVDTMRSLRVLAVAYNLGQVLMGEQDRAISLLQRLLQHAESTARYNICFGEGGDIYDIRGRTIHEAIFNVKNGSFRSPASQQGYSPFSTWTRGLAWALTGYSEELEFLESLPEKAFTGMQIGGLAGKNAFLKRFCNTARAVADFYLEYTPGDGIPYWDTGAPGLAKLGSYLEKPADPFNSYEPVDSSAACIAAQGLLRLGRHLQAKGEGKAGERYFQAGLTVAHTLFRPPYLAETPDHQGLILHSVYHRPKGWDYIPDGSSIPYGEATMWGDYHARELALYLMRLGEQESYYTFWN